MSNNTKTLRQAAVEPLQELGPLHYQQLTDEILKRELATSASKTPAASLNAVIAVDIKRNGTKSPFVRVKPGVFGLRELHTAETPSAMGTGGGLPDVAEDGSPPKDETEQRVRTPLFPTYREVRHLLNARPGRPLCPNAADRSFSFAPFWDGPVFGAAPASTRLSRADRTA